MKSIVSVAIAGMIAATSLTTTAMPADAGGKQWNKKHWNGKHHRRKSVQNNYYYYGKRRSGGWNAGAALATGAIFGLALGALAAPNSYYRPKAYAYPPPPPPPYPTAYSYSYGPQHVGWCSAKYRSYNANHNTWIGYDGLVHQCVSPY